MPVFRSYDNAELAYRILPARDGSGAPPLVCLAGGPGRDAAYLGDLGGLDEHRPLVLPDARGTGDSPGPEDPDGYAFPGLTEDLEALRDHLGLERFALLAHDAAAATAQTYAASYGDRLSHLVLLCPGSRLQGELPDDAREIFESRRDEPWWADASAALQELAEVSDLDEVSELMLRAAPLAYGRWEAPQQEHAAAEARQTNPVPRAGFWQGFDEPGRRAVLARLADVDCPVLVMTGGRDAINGMRAGEAVAESFPNARLHTLATAGHYPWVDEPRRLSALVEEFLTTPH